MKPFLNLQDVVDFEPFENGIFSSRFARIGDKIGAEKLSYRLTLLEPGHKVCPYHNHRVNEELFLILEGHGTLRFGDQEYEVGANDIIACPPGGKDVAHQITNTGNRTLKYLSLSTNEPVEICEYPDSGKIFSMVGDYRHREFGHISREQDKVDYFEGEVT